MDQQAIRARSAQAVDDLSQKLASAGEEHDFDADFNSGALAIEFEEPPAKFVVSPNAPVRQIWVSAHSKSFKLDWDEVQASFVLTETGQSLTELIQSAISKPLGEEVAL